MDRILINKHFQNKAPILKDIFNSLREKIEEFGQIRVDAVKTTINFGGKSQFSVLYVLKKKIKLEFVLNKKVYSPRIVRIRGPTNNYYTHTIELKEMSDVDQELIEWLRESYNLRN
jgi:hypothetical protein